MSIPVIQSLYATVFDSPLRYSPDLKLQPRQIKEWRWLDNKAQRLEITLRDDIVFHDGSRLTTRIGSSACTSNPIRSYRARAIVLLVTT